MQKVASLLQVEFIKPHGCCVLECCNNEFGCKFVASLNLEIDYNAQRKIFVLKEKIRQIPFPLNSKLGFDRTGWLVNGIKGNGIQEV